MDLNQTAGQPLDDQIEQFNAAWKKFNRPITTAIQTLRMDDALDLITQSRQALATAGLPDEVSEAIDCSLDFYQLNISWHPDGGDNWTVASYREGVRSFSIEKRSTLAEFIRRMHLLTMRIHAEVDGFEELDRAEITSLIADFPVALGTTPWFKAATWAFDRRDVELLGQVFVTLMLHPPEFLGQAMWQRVNMMYQLLNGKATKRDVLETIKTMQIVPQIIEFKTRILPVCEEQGLVTDEMRALLDEREEAAKNRKEILDERKTKSYIKGGS